MDEGVRAAYGARSAEYTEALGAVAAMALEDRDLISAWARDIGSPAIDAGCGPGHWTDFLHNHGVAIEGVDMVDNFIVDATKRFPDVPFRVGRLETLPANDRELGAILSWYSLIHTPPAGVPAVLREFARCIRPGGSLLLGFFEGDRVEPFDHAVITAYFWPVSVMQKLVEVAGFDVVETHARTDPGRRPHAAILATRSAGEPRALG